MATAGQIASAVATVFLKLPTSTDIGIQVWHQETTIAKAESNAVLVDDFRLGRLQVLNDRI
jgi:hypothetical protein